MAASAEEQEAIGDPARYRWRYELSSDGPGATLVTESFDCSRSPQDLRQAVRDGEGWRDAMTGRWPGWNSWPRPQASATSRPPSDIIAVHARQTAP